MRYFLVSIVLIFMTGCAKKESHLFDKKDPVYGQHLKNTKVKKIIEKQEVKTIVKVTYLNAVDPKKWDNKKQNFLVSVYNTNNEKSKFEFILNKKAPLSLKEVSKDDEVYKNIAMRNNWSGYYIYSFEDSKVKELNLDFSGEKYMENLSFTFIKE